MESLRKEDYTVGWICALSIPEWQASRLLFDEDHENVPLQPPPDHQYVFGAMNGHNIVMGCLPETLMGVASAGRVAAEMRLMFPALRFVLLVGVGGGISSGKKDVRLGDVVVSCPDREERLGGVVQYDFGKAIQEGRFQAMGALNQPPIVLLSGVSKLRSAPSRTNQFYAYLRSFEKERDYTPEFCTPPNVDRLFQVNYVHPQPERSCETCDGRYELRRYPRTSSNPQVHYGIIASGDQVMKDAIKRDEISQQYGGVLCFEMEAAGLMNTLPCIVICGICDYCDSHKNKAWQPYAAAVAAACAKELLRNIAPATVSKNNTILQVTKQDRPELLPNVNKFALFAESSPPSQPSDVPRTAFGSSGHADVGNVNSVEQDMRHMAVHSKSARDDKPPPSIPHEITARNLKSGTGKRRELSAPSRPFEVDEPDQLPRIQSIDAAETMTRSESRGTYPSFARLFQGLMIDEWEVSVPGRVRVIEVMMGPSQSSTVSDVSNVTPTRVNHADHSVRVRRFVIVWESTEKENRFQAIPIKTYNGQGVSAPNVIKSHHAIIYTGARAPPPIVGEVPGRLSNGQKEPGLLSEAIRVIPYDRERTLDPSSRLDYSDIHLIQPARLNITMFGRVHNDYLASMLMQFRTVWKELRSVDRTLPNQVTGERAGLLSLTSDTTQQRVDYAKADSGPITDEEMLAFLRNFEAYAARRDLPTAKQQLSAQQIHSLAMDSKNRAVYFQRLRESWQVAQDESEESNE